MPRRKLSKSDIFYVEKNPEKLSNEELAEMFNVGVEVIEKHLVAKPHTQPIKSNIRDKMIRGSAKRDKAGVMVMTQAASETMDDARTSGKLKGGVKKLDCITKMYDD